MGNRRDCQNYEQEENKLLSRANISWGERAKKRVGTMSREKQVLDPVTQMSENISIVFNSFLVCPLFRYRCSLPNDIEN